MTSRLLLLLLPVLLLLGCEARSPEVQAPQALIAASADHGAAEPAAADRGAEVFDSYCAICHGPEGRGDGPGGAALEPPAPDLVGPRAEHLKGIPRRTIIEDGRPGTAMVGWKAILSPEDLDAVYGFVHAMKHGPGGPMNGGGPGMDAEHRARGAMQTLGQTLKTRLVTTMKEQGPVAALDVCATNAQALTAEVTRDQGVTVGRSSLRLRNPANAAPDWVAAWLREQGERPAAGVVGLTGSATLPDGTQVMRVLQPLVIEGPCLVCHGPDAGRAPELTAALADRYPDDTATGYAAGDLRGAMWAEAAVTARGNGGR